MPTRGATYDAIRNWLHESSLSICTTGSDTCDDSELAGALTELVMEAGGPLEGLAHQRAVEMTKRHEEILTKRALASSVKRKRRRWS